MSDNRHELIAALNSSLLGQRYSPVVARNYSTYASGFLDYLGQRGIPIADVIDVQVEQYLRHAIVLFQKQRGRRPSERWHEVPRSGIHALLRLVRGQWPPAIKPICVAMRSDFQSATNTQSGCVRNAGWLARASQR